MDRRLVYLLCVSVAVLPARLAHGDDTPPRYPWRSGAHYVYVCDTRQTDADGGGEANRSRQQLQLWVYDRQEDDAELLLERTDVVDGGGRCVGGFSMRADTRGRKQIPPEYAPLLDNLEPLSLLVPEFPAAFLIGVYWDSEPDRYGRQWRSRMRAADPADDDLVRIDVELNDPTGVSELLGQSASGTYWYDRSEGIVTRCELTWIDRRMNRRTQYKVSLYRKLEVDENWGRHRGHETEAYVRVLRTQARFAEKIVAEPKRVDEFLGDMDRVWGEFLISRAGPQDSPIHRFAEARRIDLRSETAVLRERARLAERWIGRSAAEWSLQDLTGQTHRSEELRGQYAIECFWSAESPASLRMFRTLRQLQAAAPEKLRVICLNIDADAAGARIAAEKTGGELVQLLAGSPVGADAPTELPVLRLLDPESHIVQIIFGWRPTFADVAQRVAE